jgi:hypothetical protein
LRVTVTFGITSSSSGCRSSSNTTGTCASNTQVPGGISGHDHDTPVRPIRRKNRTPIRTSGPPRNRMLSSGSLISTTYPSSETCPALSQGQSAAKSSPPAALLRASICTPLGLTNMW